MKNTKEIKTILTAILAINQTSEHKDKDITLILDYAFRRIFDCNANLIIFACAGKTKDEVMPSVMKLLEEDTKYKEYLEEYKI